MAAVYLWRPTWGTLGLTRVGHISILLKDGTYISFWPDQALKSKAIFGVRSVAKSLTEDVKAEGGLPDDQLAIPETLIDIEKIKEFWKKKMKEKYSFLVENCATTVKEALRIGCKFDIAWWYAADPQYVFAQIRHGLQNI